MIRKLFKSRRLTVRTVSFLTAAFAVVSGFAVQNHFEAAQYRWYLQNQYQHSFSELTTSMSELDTALQKGMYATSPCLLSSLLTQIYGKAMTAQLALSELPYSDVELEQTASFVAKAGDYALALSRSSTLNGGISETEQEGLVQLASVSGKLSQTLQDLQGQILNGGLVLDDVAEAQTRLSRLSEGEGEITAGSSFQEMEADFPELPSLIYDGPFSEHLTGRAPVALEGLDFADQNDAVGKAAEFLGMAPEAFTLISAGEGTLPTWGFSAAADDGEIYIEISQVGCKVVSLFNSCKITNTVLTAEEGISAAADFLQAHGYSDMAESYWAVQDNKITVNFSPKISDVVIYPDLIKVSVGLDDGDIVGFEASGYLSNHRDRDLPAPAISSDTAREKVSENLNLLTCRLALIPTGGEYEVLCYEFKCRTEDDRHVIVYVNALTGEEEKILLLIEDETGTLVL